MLRLQQCRDLPSLPGVAFELLRQFRESEVDLKETSEIIQKDPALSASVLRFVNSAAFGIRREITSITHAISLLGLNAIRTLALSFSLVRGLRSTDHKGFDYTRFWQRSLLSGMAARALGSTKGVTDREGLFLAGLLSPSRRG
jgi:HD-like signal output (HDOD) protein